MENRREDKEDTFTSIRFTSKNIDKYHIRHEIFNSLNQSRSYFKGNLIDVGCGKMPYKKYILSNFNVTEYTGLDIENALEYEPGVIPDYTWDGITMPFKSDSYDIAFSTEVLEHCPEPSIILNEVFRILKPGGTFFFSVPFLWPLHEVPNDEFRYTPFSLDRILREAGFASVEIKATGGWHASLAQMLGLWVRRAPMSNKLRTILTFLLKPLMRILLSNDKKVGFEFKESQMITGLTGVALKK